MQASSDGRRLPAAAAQTLTSRVEGTVQDEAGGVIPGAAVTMTEVDTNVAREAFTSDLGLYLFPQVPAGTYRVEAAAPGFSTTVISSAFAARQIQVGMRLSF